MTYNNLTFLNIHSLCVVEARIVFYISSAGKFFNMSVMSNFQKSTKQPGFRVVFKKAKSYLITTLRAPKHFKVGRHHYELVRRRGVIFLNFVEYNSPVVGSYNTSAVSVYCAASACSVRDSVVVPVLSTVHGVNVLIRSKFSLNVL